MDTTPVTPLPQEPFAGLTPGPASAPPAASPDNPPWAVPGALALWLASVLLLVIMQQVFLLPYAVRRGVNTAAALVDFALSDKTAIFLQVLAIFPAHLLTLGLAWAVVTRFGRHPFLRTLGWEWDRRFNFWRSAGLAVALLSAGLVIIWLTGNPETPLDQVINSSRVTAVTTALMATFTAPLVEEIVYRGVLYSALRRAVGVVWAAVTVLLLFALVHVPQYKTSVGVMATILMLSLFLTTVRAYTGKLLPCVVIHLIFNGIQSFFIVLGPYLEKPPPVIPDAPGIILAVARLAVPSG